MTMIKKTSACLPSIREGHALLSWPPMPLNPPTALEGRSEVRVETTTTQDRRRILCTEGGFDVTR